MKIDGVDNVIQRAGGKEGKNKVMSDPFLKTALGDIFVFDLTSNG